MTNDLSQMTILSPFGSPLAPRPAVGLLPLLTSVLLRRSKLLVGH